MRPHFDLQTQALAYYLQFHIQTPRHVQNVPQGLSECVSVWKISGRACPMVDLALSAMALAVFSRVQQLPVAAIEASSKYYRVLRVAQEQISQLGVSTLDERDFDACLLAIFLMGRYELTKHPPADLHLRDSFSSLPSWSHHDGAMSILKLWNDKARNNPATFIMKQTRRGLMRSFLLRTLPLPDWMLDGSRFGEHGLELDYDRIYVQIVNLRYATWSYRQQNVFQTMKAKELNDEALDLDNALQGWAAQFPTTWSYQQYNLSDSGSNPGIHFYSSIAYGYSSSIYAAVWSQYFAARMLINSTRLKILSPTQSISLVGSTFEEQRLACVTQLKARANDLASTIPFCLERFRVHDKSDSPNHRILITLNQNEEIKPYLATLAVWPLSIASGLEGVDKAQQLWFRSELSSLGKLLGSGSLECAEADHWMKL